MQSVVIAGAGPAGLAAAITLARAGWPVVVHEAQPQVGYRFRRDLQGLENWTTPQDVLEQLASLGISTNFRYLPCDHGTAFDAWGQHYTLSSDTPFFYLVERGPEPGSLDSAMLEQAKQLGVEIRFNSHITTSQGADILATGPKAADVIAVGYHFDTTMPDGFWVICDNRIAPQGYAYLLIMSGRGTVKSCMFRGFKQQAHYARKTVEAFERLVGLQMLNPLPHGGIGCFRGSFAMHQELPYLTGERAGIQDALWGFGIRMAIQSGILAARSLLERTEDGARWQQPLQSALESGRVNRMLYGSLGNYGYRQLLRYLQGRPDINLLLRQHYGSSLLKRLLAPLAQVLT